MRLACTLGLVGAWASASAGCGLLLDVGQDEAGDQCGGDLLSGDWSWRRQLTVSGDQVAGELADFPVLVVIDADTRLAAGAQPDGRDVVFALEGERLSHEIELYEGGRGRMVAWVRLPALSPGADTTLHMYYGNPTADGCQDSPSVWDPGHAGVWHMAADPATGRAPDSTTNRLGGVIGGAPVQVDGPVGPALDFDGSGDFVDLGNPPALRLTGAVTIQAWFNARAAGNIELISKVGGRGDYGWDISFDDGTVPSELWVMFRLSSDGIDSLYTGYEPVELGRWHHVVGVFDPGLTRRFYMDGALVADCTPAITAGQCMTGVPTAQHDSSMNVNIARKPGGAGALDGLVDEVRVSHTARSDAWILTGYANQASPATFLGVGPEEPVR